MSTKTPETFQQEKLPKIRAGEFYEITRTSTIRNQRQNDVPEGTIVKVTRVKNFPREELNKKIKAFRNSKSDKATYDIQIVFFTYNGKECSLASDYFVPIEYGIEKFSNALKKIKRKRKHKQDGKA